MISEVEFALEDEGAEFVRVGTIEWVGFPEFGFGTVVTGHDNLFDSLGKCSNFCIGVCGPAISSGVLLSTGSACADLGCADILVGVGGWVGGWVAGLEFPELSRRVN